MQYYIPNIYDMNLPLRDVVLVPKSFLHSLLNCSWLKLHKSNLQPWFSSMLFDTCSTGIAYLLLSPNNVLSSAT